MTTSSIYRVFFAESTLLGRTGVTSFRMQFEKVGSGLLRGGKRREGEGVVRVKERGDEEKVNTGTNKQNLKTNRV